MNGETNLQVLLKTMKPELNPGRYVFCTAPIDSTIPANCLFSFREKEGITIVMDQSSADQLGLKYSFLAAWITLTVHSSLEAVGLTAAFAQALAAENISCNVVAAYYHDHIFVDNKDADKAIQILQHLSA